MSYAASHSVHSVLSTAAKAVCDDVRKQLDGQTPDLSFVFVSHAHAEDFETLPELLQQQLGSKVLIGCAGETVVGIDFRPNTGQLFGVGSTSRVYVINVVTGAATLVGAGAFTPVLSGMHFGVDFNPTADRIRCVGDAGHSLVAALAIWRCCANAQWFV